MTFYLFWLDGKRETVEGDSIASAMNAAGYGEGALGALDFYSGDSSCLQDYEWDGHGWTWTEKKRSEVMRK